MEIMKLRSLALEIFKTLNNLNSNFKKDIFNCSPYRTHKIHQVMVIESSELLGNIHGTP